MAANIIARKPIIGKVALLGNREQRKPPCIKEYRHNIENNEHQNVSIILHHEMRRPSPRAFVRIPLEGILLDYIFFWAKSVLININAGIDARRPNRAYILLE